MKRKQSVSGQNFDPVDLSVVEVEGGYALSLAGEILLTEWGIPVQHVAKPLLEHMASEFDGHGTMKVRERKVVAPRFFGSYALFGSQKQWIEQGKEELSVDFADCLLRNPVLNEVPGPEARDQYARWGPIFMWLGETYDQLRRSASSFLYCLEERDAEAKLALARHSSAVTKIRDQYLALAPEQRAAVAFLHVIHSDNPSYHVSIGPVLFPLGLALGRCTEGEYAQGVMAGMAILSGAFPDVDNKAHRKSFEGLRSDARTALDYIRFYQEGTPTRQFRDMVATGETPTLEFKSTLRFNLRAERHDDQITHTCVKTVAAFLNSEGGRLLIGVADDGKIVGIERDEFPNTDKFQLHLLNVLKSSLGKPPLLV